MSGIGNGNLCQNARRFASGVGSRQGHRSSRRHGDAATVLSVLARMMIVNSGAGLAAQQLSSQQCVE